MGPVAGTEAWAQLLGAGRRSQGEAVVWLLVPGMLGHGEAKMGMAARSLPHLGILRGGVWRAPVPGWKRGRAVWPRGLWEDGSAGSQAGKDGQHLSASPCQGWV